MMRISEYKNFDLEIHRIPSTGALRVRVLDSPAGDCDFIDLRWPFGLGEEDDLVGQIRGALVVRRGVSIEQARIQDYGARLFEAVFQGQIQQLYRTCLSELGAAQSLRLRLRIPRDVDSHATPWEFLFDCERNEFPVVKERTPIVRYVAIAKRVEPLSVEPPLEILVAISAPRDLPRLDNYLDAHRRSRKRYLCARTHKENVDKVIDGINSLKDTRPDEYTRLKAEVKEKLFR